MNVNAVSTPINNAGIQALQLAQTKNNEISEKIIKLSLEIKTNANKEKILGKVIDIFA